MRKEVNVKSAISKHTNAFPVFYDVNPYRGCSIGCQYCFAQYSHSYLNLKDFTSDIIVKKNIAASLHSDLRKRYWNRDQLKLGGISDIYQEAEEQNSLFETFSPVEGSNKCIQLSIF